MNREPVAIIGAIEVAAVAVIGVFAAVLEWDAELSASIVAAVSAIIIALGTIWQRSQVDSPVTVARKVDDALNTPVPK